jgi:hypothetical protein
MKRFILFIKFVFKLGHRKQSDKLKKAEIQTHESIVLRPNFPNLDS